MSVKSLSIKLGKGIEAVKREGFLRGGKRIAGSLGKMFSRVGSGDILFVSSGVGDSARYRSWHQAEELGIHGFRAAVTVQENPFLNSYSDKFKIFIFQRTLYASRIARFINKLKASGREIIFETDDLVFDPEYIKLMDFWKNMNALEKKQYENGLGGEILGDPYVKTAVTTTSFLAQKLRERGKNVFVSKNKLSRADVETADSILSSMPSIANQDTIKIIYASGTASHDRDFATIEKPLLDILEKYKAVKLLLVGPLNISERFDAYSHRIERSSYVPREEMFKLIAGADINLAPLEMGNAFCESKSELKWFEAGVLGIPTVAVKNQTFSEAIVDGADGYLAGNADEWRDKISALISDGQLRKNMGAKAREKILRDYTTLSSHNDEYYAYLRSKLI